MSNMEKFLEALKDLANATLNVNRELEISDKATDIVNGELNHYYPYTESFDEVACKVRDWYFAMKMWAEGKTLQEIEDELNPKTKMVIKCDSSHENLLEYIFRCNHHITIVDIDREDDGEVSVFTITY